MDKLLSPAKAVELVGGKRAVKARVDALDWTIKDALDKNTRISCKRTPENTVRVGKIFGKKGAEGSVEFFAFLLFLLDQAWVHARAILTCHLDVRWDFAGISLTHCLCLQVVGAIYTWELDLSDEALSMPPFERV